MNEVDPKVLLVLEEVDIFEESATEEREGLVPHLVLKFLIIKQANCDSEHASYLLFCEGSDAGLKLEVTLFLFGWNLLFHDGHVIALELFVGLSEEEGVYEGFFNLLEFFRLQRFQVVDEGVNKLGGRIEVPGKNLHNIEQSPKRILVLVVHKLLDNQQKNLVFENIVFPGVVNNECGLSLNNIGDVLFLEKITLTHGFYYLVDQL